MPTDAELAARVEAFTGPTDQELASRVEGFSQERSGVPGTTARAESFRSQVAAGADATELAQEQLTTTGGQAAASDVEREPDTAAAIGGAAAGMAPAVVGALPLVLGAVATHPKTSAAVAAAIDQLVTGGKITRKVADQIMGLFRGETKVVGTSE